MNTSPRRLPFAIIIQTQQGRRQRSRPPSLPILVFLLSLLLVSCPAVMVMAATECITSRQDLQDAVKAWLANKNDGWLIDTYGATIGTWCIDGSVTDFSYLFAGATLLQTIDLQAWNVSAVTSVAYMFQGCAKLSSITGLEGWNVGRVTNFSHTFDGCTALQADLSAWNTASATDLSSTFTNCDVLDFDLTAWNTAKVTTLAHFLDGAEGFSNALQPSLPWNTQSLVEAQFAFANTGRFDADLSAWNVQKVTTMEGMFHTAVSFSGRGLEHWETSSLTTLAHAFEDTWNFNADIGAWYMDTVTDLTATFRSATAFNQDLSRWHVGHVTSFVETFHGAHAFNQNLCDWRQPLANANVAAAVWDETFSGTGCPDTSTPSQQAGLVIGSFCHSCDEQGSGDATNHHNTNPSGGEESSFTPTDDLIQPEPAGPWDDNDDESSSSSSSTDDGSTKQKPTTLQIFEHDVDVLAIVIAFCSGGALVGWLVRRHMLRQRILRRHMEVYAQVQPYDLDADSVELTSIAIHNGGGGNGSVSNTSASDDPWSDHPHREEGKQPFFA